MKIKTGLLVLFLLVGLLGVPNCIFAQEYEESVSETFLQINLPDAMLINSLNPEVKGGGGGGKGGGSSGSKSSSVKVKSDGDDDIDTGLGTGWGWITILIIVIGGLGILGVLVWYFVLRKR